MRSSINDWERILLLLSDVYMRIFLNSINDLKNKRWKFLKKNFFFCFYFVSRLWLKWKLILKKFICHINQSFISIIFKRINGFKNWNDISICRSHFHGFDDDDDDDDDREDTNVWICWIVSSCNWILNSLNWHARSIRTGNIYKSNKISSFDFN